MMHNFFYVFLCFSLFLASCKNYDEIPCVPSDLKKNVRAFYSFNNGSLVDKSLEGNNLTMHGSPFPVRDRFNNINCAYHFNIDNDDYFSAPGTFLNGYQNKEFTISLWYQPDSININNLPFKYELLVGRVNDFKLKCPSQYGEWSIGLHDCRSPAGSVNTESIWYLGYKSFPPGPDNQNCNLYLNSIHNQWIHLAFTFSKGTKNLYINGKLSNSQMDGPCGDNSKDLGDLIVGKLFTGVLDDVIIFNKELTSNEVTQLFEMDACCE